MFHTNQLQIMTLILETKVDMLRTKCSFQILKHKTPVNTIIDVHTVNRKNRV